MKSKHIIINFLWKFMEKGSAQVVSFIISIVLARLIEPSAYGTLALATIIISILQVFIDSGLGIALVQKKEADDLDFSSVFFCNIAICAVMYMVLYFVAPAISAFYNTSELTGLIRVSGLMIIVAGIRSIQQAYVERTMQFKKFFLSTLSATLCSGAVGLVLAYLGFGVWALVALNLTNVIVGTIVLWYAVKWRPKLQFSVKRMKPLLHFGWKVLGSGLVMVIYANLRQLLVGKFYTTSDLAYYNKGNSLPNVIVPTIQSSITSVLLPAIAKKQTDHEQVKTMTGNAVAALSCVLWPMMVGLAACSEVFIRVVLTDKWLPAVQFMQIFCIEAAIWPISSVYVNTIRAIGRSDLDLKIQVTVRIIGITSLFLAIAAGPMAIAICAFACSCVELIILIAVNRSVLKYSIRGQLGSFAPFAVLSFLMGAAVYAVGKLKINMIILLGLQILTGIIVYAVLILLFRKNMILTMRSLFKKDSD